jgi:hypothetical protein
LGLFGAAVLDEKFARKIDNDSEPAAARKPRKLSVAALFEESGEIAPVDVRRFATRAGEIIARGARATGRSQRVRRIAGGLRAAR